MQIRPVADRGATLVEYALLVGLIAVVSIGSLQVLTRDSSGELADRGGQAGAPDLDATGVVPPPPGGGGGGGGSTGGSTAPPIIANVSGPTGCYSGGPGNWTANFSVTVTDSSNGAPVSQALVEGRFLRYDNDDVLLETIAAPQIATNPDGRAPFSLTGLSSNGPNPTGRVEFQLVAVSGDDPPIIYTVPVPPPAASVDQGVPPQCP